MAFLPMFTPQRGVSRVPKRPRVCTMPKVRCCTAREPTDSRSVPRSASGDNTPLRSVSDEAITSSLEVVVHPSIRDFRSEEWDALADGGCGNPFLRHHFLATLEDTGCACAETGWAPRHVSIRDRKTGEIYAAAPVYAKAHSMGEFIFDNSWAEASYATGIPYYPKLLVAPPFTPATGRRLLTSPKVDASGQRKRILRIFADALVQVCGALRMSGCHVNFCLDDECEALSKAGFMRRQGVQYHFVNSTQEDCGQTRGFSDFDDYLDCFRSKKRSNIRRERRHVREKSRLRIDVVQGKDISSELLDEMYWIYKSTIDKMYYGRQYLTREFFRRLGDDESFKERLCFVLARDRDSGSLKAGTFNVIGAKNGVFYGRYWGCLEEHKFLHFETCYYAAIEHVINNGLTRMEPGAGGGDFKFLRGFEPTTTQSMHYIRDARLAGAVGKFLEMETSHIDEAVEQMIGESAIRAKTKANNEPGTSNE